MTFDATALRDAFRNSNMECSRRALWCRDYPGAPPNTCRYCGKSWRQWAGSKLDGHAACIVTDGFKQQLMEVLKPSTVTYQMIADAIGMSPSVVRSWTFPVRAVRGKKTA
jgi:hypothetical protein